jgi:hypothetical protein
MLNGHLYTAPSGAKGFDCNGALSAGVAEAFVEAGYSFAVRYVRRQQFHAYDLTADEASRILSAGLALMAVQHVESAESWIPSQQKGSIYGATAATEASRLGMPHGSMLWCDLEGVAPGTPNATVIEYCNQWHAAVAGAGFLPGLYIGWHCGLTGHQLYEALRFTHYWAAYNLNVDQYPVVRGVQMQQRARKEDDSRGRAGRPRVRCEHDQAGWVRRASGGARIGAVERIDAPRGRVTTHLRLTQDLAEGNAVPYKKLGIEGDGKHFDHAGVNNLASAIDEGGIVKLGDSPVMLLGETVDWRKLRGKIFTSERDPMPDGVNVPRFIWDGERYGTMWKLDRNNSVRLDGLVVESDDRSRGRAPAGVVFDLDGGQDMYPGEPEIGSSCSLSRIRHITNTPDPDVLIERSTFPNAKGEKDTVMVPGPIFIALSTQSQDNWEYCRFDDVNGNGNNAGTFFFQGRSPNIVATRLGNVRQMIGYKRGIYAHGGSVHLDYINATWCEWALWLENGSQVSTARRIIGENNAHWAYIDAPLESYGNKWDPTLAAPLGADGRGFIHFGPNASWVDLRGAYDGGARNPGVVVFTFDNDASARVVDLKVIAPRNQTFTRAHFGIDRQALLGKGNAGRQARFVRFWTNPGTISDLPGGLLEFNWPTPVVETAAGEWVNDLPVMRKISKTTVDYADLTPGVAAEHVDTPSHQIRQRTRFDDDSLADTPLGRYEKVKP